MPVRVRRFCRSTGHASGPGTAWLGWLLLVVLGMPTISGCGGCLKFRSEPKTAEQLLEERRKREEERRKPPFEVGAWTPRPHQRKADRWWYKPGHWVSATIRAKANKFTLVGDLVSELVDRRGRPIPLRGMPYAIRFSRRVSLPKGQSKVFETLLFAPRTDQPSQVSVRIEGHTPRGARWEGSHVVWPLKSYQYVFVVLATAPSDFAYVRNLDSVKNPYDLKFDSPELAYYHVQLVEAQRHTALPSHALYWTSVAYVLMGELDPGVLRRSQQQALLDWVHWGGHLIVSGPDALEPLRHTLLADYLPAVRKEACQLTAEQLQEISDRWTVPVFGRPGRPLEPTRPWAGIQLGLHRAARVVPGTGGLVAERRVGRGRIVVSAFRLNQGELVSWPGFDGFFNACLLRRPPRKFYESEGLVRVGWADGHDPFDPRLLTAVRYFTRDAGRRMEFYRPPETGAFLPYGGYRAQEATGVRAGTDVASWDDFSPVSQAAREALTAAAAIEIPDRWFVIGVVGAYLLVLVPLNWLVFRIIGRVELAWATAPLIAIIWTGLVIRLARLDIGFARSQTAIHVLELQGGYPRAHLTSYLALYTSLSTTYRIESPDPGAVVLPFAREEGASELRWGRQDLSFRYGRQAELGGLFVRSNVTGLAHSEQMLDLGGSLQLADRPGGRLQVTNQTPLTLHEARVVRKTATGRLEGAWLGTLEPGQAAVGQYIAIADPGELAQRAAARRGGAGLPQPLDLGPLIAQAAWGDLEQGEVRLVAWSVDPLAGVVVKPRAPQVRESAVVVAHLAYGFGPDPQRDRNCRLEVE